jgi:hypothetical protein
MKIKNIIINILIIYLFSQNIFSQQVDTLKLRVRDISNSGFFIPCQDMCNCLGEIKFSPDTLYITYNIDTLVKDKELLIVYSYGLKKRDFKICIPLLKSKYNYIVIRSYQYVYLFKRKKNKYVFQRCK